MGARDSAIALALTAVGGLLALRGGDVGPVGILFIGVVMGRMWPVVFR